MAALSERQGARRAALARGEVPDSMIAPGPDFGDTNARAMAMYDSRDRAVLLAQLRDSAAAWDETNGVRMGEWPVSNGAIVAALTEDYDHHREGIAQWPTR